MNKADFNLAAKQIVNSLGDKKYTKEEVEKIMEIAKGLMRTIRILVNNREGFTLTFTNQE